VAEVGDVDGVDGVDEVDGAAREDREHIEDDITIQVILGREKKQIEKFPCHQPCLHSFTRHLGRCGVAPACVSRQGSELHRIVVQPLH